MGTRLSAQREIQSDQNGKAFGLRGFSPHGTLFKIFNIYKICKMSVSYKMNMNPNTGLKSRHF